MPIITDAPDVLHTDVAVASSDFYSDPATAAATLRRVAARDLGLSDVVVHGTVDEYRSLDAGTQVALTDEMAKLITQYPNSFPINLQQAATSRVQNPLFNQPLADSTFSGNLMEQVANGQFEMNALGGGLGYLADIGKSVAAGLAVWLIIDLIGKHQSNKESRT